MLSLRGELKPVGRKKSDVRIRAYNGSIAYANGTIKSGCSVVEQFSHYEQETAGLEQGCLLT